MDDFSRLGLSEDIASALASFGFSAPTPVQKTAIPLVLAGRDLYMESETGTGKTFAYLAPALELIVKAGASRTAGIPRAKESPETAGDGGMISRIPPPQSHPQPQLMPLPGRAAPVRRADGPGLLVAAPTQELAVQIGRECEKLIAASGLSLEVAVLLGGSPLSRQETALKRRPAIVIGTLGRLADLAKSTMLRLKGLYVIVFDEADRMLAPETEGEMLGLLESAPRDCTRLLVSATLPRRIRLASAPFMKDPVFIDVQGKPVLAGDIEHWCLYCDSRKRVEFLRRFDAAVKPARCLVFLAQAARVAETAEKLAAHDLPVGAISARMDKEERRVALERFARGETRYLVTSDLAARGLDIPGISHILSLDLPEETTIYTHRAGRTGRAGAKGVSVILVDKVELERASKMAVKGGFVFHCKLLAEGSVLEPTTAEFFDMVESAWEEKTAFRARKKTSDAQRGPERGPYPPVRDWQRPVGPRPDSVPAQRKPEAARKPRPGQDSRQWPGGSGNRRTDGHDNGR